MAYGGRRKRTARTKNKRRSNAKPKTTFAKKVQAVISRNIEDKYVASYPGKPDQLQPGASWSASGSAIWQSPAIRNNVSVSNIYPIMPFIQQSDPANLLYSGADQRVGNRIKPKTLTMNFVVSIRGENFNSNLLLVRMMVLNDKSLKNTKTLIASAGQPGTPVDSELFNYGNGTYGGFNGSPYDINWRVNKNRYSVISDRILKLEKGTGQTPAPGNTVPYTGSVTTIDHLMTHRYTVRIPCPEFLKYETNTSEYPSNFAPFWACGFVQPDGDGTVDYLNQYIMVNYTTHLTYEDA